MTATRMRDHRYIGDFSAISYRASSFPPSSLSFRLFLAPVRVYTYIYVRVFFFYPALVFAQTGYPQYFSARGPL